MALKAGTSGWAIVPYRIGLAGNREPLGRFPGHTGQGWEWQLSLQSSNPLERTGEREGAAAFLLKELQSSSCTGLNSWPCPELGEPAVVT